MIEATCAREAIVSNGHEKISTVALARANQMFEKTIFWGLIATVIGLGIVMINSVPL